MEVNITLQQALERASTPLRQKMQYSIELLRKAERLALAYDSENGYFLAFSGGKDSQALFHIAQLGGVKFQAHMALTSVDPPEVIRFVRTQYPEVILTKPKDSIFNIAVQKRILPTMRVRWCCKEYKEKAGAGKVTLIGIRHEESSRRAMRNEVEIDSRKFSGTLDELDAYRGKRAEELSKPRRGRKPSAKPITIVNAKGERTLGCINGKESLLISPIIHWTERDVWEFLNDVVCVSHCSLYDEGFTRIGCILCPMSQPRQKQQEIVRWPHVKRNWIKAIKAIRSGGGASRTAISGGISLPASRPAGGLEAGCAKSQRINKGLWAGFSEGSSPDRLTEEQENEIAENIFDWWISGKAYKQWYAEKFLQKSLDFGEDIE